MGWRRLVLLVACLGIAVACSRLFRGGGGTVTVAKVRVETTAPQVTVVGQLVASESAEIAFPYEVRIEKVFVNEGDHLLAGDPLVSLSQAEAQARLAQLRAARKEAEALLERNAFIFKNRDRLLEEGKLDQSQYAGVESEVRVGEAAVERAKADIAALEQQAAAGTVASPIAGIVQKRLTHPGAVVGASQPIIVVTRIDPIFVWFRLTADESQGVAPGIPLTVRLEELPGERFEATIHHISPELQQAGKTFDVWAAIPNPNEVLKIGMRSFAEFTTMKQHQVMVVPASAVFPHNGASHVFRVQQGIARLSKVTVKGRSEAEVTLVDGVAPDELVVVRGQQSLQDGMPVDVWR